MKNLYLITALLFVSCYAPRQLELRKPSYVVDDKGYYRIKFNDIRDVPVYMNFNPYSEKKIYSADCFTNQRTAILYYKMYRKLQRKVLN